MSTNQILVTISVAPIIAQAFIEGGDIDPGLSLSLLARIFRDHLQAVWPQYHASVGFHDSASVKLVIIHPGIEFEVRRRIRKIFDKILQRENWLISL